MPAVASRVYRRCMTVTTRIVTTILVYEDITAEHDFLVNTFGFGPGRVDRDDDGLAVHGEISIGDQTVWLHRVAAEHGLGSVTELGAATGMLHVVVDNVDAHHAQVAATGARINHPPTDMPYGQREYSVYDVEGRIWSFATPL